MKAIKRTVAALLATLMLATSTSFTLAAEEYTDKEAVVVAKVNAAGIMTGTDKGFEPSKSLTRAEAAAIIVRMKGISESATKTMAGTTLFTDVAAAHWASGYVNEASQLGIVKGVSATEFAPDREVTVAEFVTMAVRALGAGIMVDTQGVWPTNYINFANEEGLLDDVTAIYTATASRINAATIVANTLEAPIWAKTKATTNNEVTWEKSADIVKANGDIVPAETILNKTLNILAILNETFDADDIDIKNRKINNTNVADGVDMATLKAGVEYDIWYNTKSQEIVGIWKAEDSRQTSVQFTEVSKKLDSNNKVTFKSEGKDVVYKVTGDTRVFYNGIEKDGYTASTEFAKDENKFGTLVVDGTEIVSAYFEKYEYAKLVDEVTKDKIKFADIETDSNYNKIGGNFTKSYIEYTDEDNTFYVTKDGKEISIKDVKEDDVLFFYVEDDSNDDIFHILVVNNDVQGEVKSVGSTYIKVDDTKYTVAEGLDFSAVDPEEEWILYLNVAGKVVALEEVEGTSEYAVIKSMEAYNDRKGTNIEITLAYADGTVSDKMSLDLDSDDLAAIKAALVGTDPSTVNDSIEDTKCWGVFDLGAVVDYEIKSGKISDLVPVVDGDDSAVEAASWNSTDEVYEDGASLTIGKTKSYFTVDNTKYYVDKNTDILVVKAGSKDYEVKVVKVELADLDTTANLTVTVADIDDNNNAKLVVIDQTLGNKAKTSIKSDDWAIVIEKATTKNNDFEYEYVLASANGETKTYYTENNDYSELALGIFSFADEEITDIDTEDYLKEVTLASDDITKVTDANKLYITSTDENVLTLANAKVVTGTTTYATFKENTFEMAEDVLFIKHETKNKGVVGKEKEVYTLTKEPAFATSDETLDIEDAKEIEKVLFEKVDDNIYEVIAVIYAK